jgi:hypothetical protein
VTAILSSQNYFRASRQHRDNSLHFSWKCTNPEVSLDTLVTTSIEVNCPREHAVAGGITLSEEQFEELQH